MQALGFAHQIPAEIARPIYPNLIIVAKLESAGVGCPVRPIGFPVQIKDQRDDRMHTIDNLRFYSYAVQEEVNRYLQSFYCLL